MDPDQATAALEAQRTEIRDLVATLAADAATALDGRVSTASGHWEGCDSVFPEGHRNFHYRASARIDAGPAAARPFLAALDTAGLADVAPGDRPGGQSARENAE